MMQATVSTAADPVYEAIRLYRIARAEMEFVLATTDDDARQDIAMDARAAAMSAALQTHPTTLRGLREFCLFGHELAQEIKTISYCTMGDFTPRGAGTPSVQDMFLDTLRLASFADS